MSQVPEKDEYSITRQQMRAQIDVCMGGKAAEELIFGGLAGPGGHGGRALLEDAGVARAAPAAPRHVSCSPIKPCPHHHPDLPPGEDHVTSGATSDLKQATRMARHMVVDCGMSDAIGPVAVGEEQSPVTRQAVDAEVQRMLKAAYARVTGCGRGRGWGGGQARLVHLPAAPAPYVGCQRLHRACAVLHASSRHHHASSAPPPPHRSLLREKERELHALAQALLADETLTQAEIRSLLEALHSPALPGSTGARARLEPDSGVAVEGEASPAPAAAASFPVPPAA